MSESQSGPDPSVGIPQAVATAIGELCMHWSEQVGLERMPLWQPTTGAMLVWLENAVRTLALSASDEHKREILMFDPKRRCRPGRKPTSEKWDDRQMRKQKHEEVAAWYQERYGGAPKDFLEHQRELSERGRANVSARWDNPHADRPPAKPRTKGELNARRMASKALLLRRFSDPDFFKVGDPHRIQSDLCHEATARLVEAGREDPSIFDATTTHLEIEVNELTLGLHRHLGDQDFSKVQVDLREVIASLPSSHGKQASAAARDSRDPGTDGTDGAGGTGQGSGS